MFFLGMIYLKYFVFRCFILKIAIQHYVGNKRKTDPICWNMVTYHNGWWNTVSFEELRTLLYWNHIGNLKQCCSDLRVMLHFHTARDLLFSLIPSSPPPPAPHPNAAAKAKVLKGILSLNVYCWCRVVAAVFIIPKMESPFWRGYAVFTRFWSDKYWLCPNI